MTYPTDMHERPLVLLTRQQEDNEKVGGILDQRSVPWVSMPCIRLAAVRPGEEELSVVDRALPLSAVTFASRWCVRGLATLKGRVGAWGVFSGKVVVGAVGPATADELADAGFRVDLVADPPTGATLGRLLVKRLKSGSVVLLPHGDRPRPELGEMLVEAGMRAIRLKVYEHKPVRLGASDLPCPVDRVEVVVCGSPSGVDALLDGFPLLKDRIFVAIGGTTGAHLESKGVFRVVVSPGTDPASLARAAGRAIGH